ncbi:hypothetical protein GKE82_21305 [Conexibacter sp. W3-3-2]|uniref:hypothetical protein n=1 Tax=Conexibacter sp. W3-3-2 TaxID=2675227 RepID=UPI0012B922DB|nr:hypothetical protein [Conexibacter sp. W3-3-2]MTD46756.1 hypothetical protein [Conexibacter sp. W3-3-2]
MAHAQELGLSITLENGLPCGRITAGDGTRWSFTGWTELALAVVEATTPPHDPPPTTGAPSP